MAGTVYRPGGLTVLAVVNFILAAIYALGTLSIVAILAIGEEEVRKITKEEPPPKEALYFGLGFLPLVVVLLIVSGVGYLRQKRFLGRLVGNVYAVLSLVSVIIGVAMLEQFSLSTIIDLVYPVLTLLLLNLVFKDDFPNP